MPHCTGAEGAFAFVEFMSNCARCPYEMGLLRESCYVTSRPLVGTASVPTYRPHQMSSFVSKIRLKSTGVINRARPSFAAAAVLHQRQVFRPRSPLQCCGTFAKEVHMKQHTQSLVTQVAVSAGIVLLVAGFAY